MRWGKPRSSWARTGAGLLVAIVATLAVTQIFVGSANDRTQEAAVRQFAATAGRIEPEYIDEPTAVAPAPEPITISLTIDRSAPVLSYLEEAGLDRDEAQRWASSFVGAAAGGMLQSGHSLTLYKDPDDGSLRELKYN